MRLPTSLAGRMLLVALAGVALPVLLGLPFLLSALGGGDLSWEDPPEGRASSLAEAPYDPGVPLDGQVRAALERAGFPASGVHCEAPPTGARQVRCDGTVPVWDRVVINLLDDRLVVVGAS